MNEQQKAMLDRRLKLQRGAAIIEGTQDKFRQDGYSNMLNKYGTAQDNSTAYQYNQEIISNDLELIRLYEGNGLFTKIIDRPSEEAVKHGFDINYGDESIAEYVDDRMDALELEEKFSTAEKWARLYGGSIIVMLVDDGRGLEEPLDWNNVRSIEELRVFERAIVQPDYSSMYHFHFMDTLNSKKKFGEPEYYQVFSIYGYFLVHRSRCLVFRNGRLPEQTTNAIYRYWGIPEYVKIKRALRECITSHEDGVKLLERSVQAIYKMKNLANMLSTEDGENKVLQRLQVIDMARGILNSIAIDTDGEDYDFKTLQMSGIKDVIDATCNMLSAVTDIPQTILFGRSPAGMNSTGESDFENYYNMVENIQKQNMKANARTVIDLILKQGALEGAIPEVPKYKMKFAALWSMSDTEKANVEQTKAQTEYTKAQTAQIYMDGNVLDPSEVRKSLASEGEFEIEEVISDNDLDLPDDVFDLSQTTDDPTKSIFSTSDLIEIAGTDIDKKKDDDSGIISIEVVETGDEEINIGEQIDVELPNEDGGDFPAAAVIIINDGKILCASRRNNEGICGPGGHAEDGETSEETAVREAIEEFNIVPLNLLPLGQYKGSSGQYMPSMVYFTDQFSGTPEADGSEMMNERWLSLEELMNEQLFPPFKESLDMLVDLLSGNNLTTSNSADTLTLDGGPGSGNWGHAGRPGKIGGSAKGGGKTNRTGTKETGFSSAAKERKKSKSSGSSVKGQKVSREVKQFVTNAETHKKLIRKNQTILAYGKRVTIEEALLTDKVSIKEGVAKELGKATGTKAKVAREVAEAKKNGTLNDYINKHRDSYIDDVVKKQEKAAEKLKSPMEKERHQLCMEYNSQVESVCMDKCSSKILRMEQYYDLLDKRNESLTGEEFALERAYAAGGLGFRAEDMNSRMYSGKQNEMSDSEKRFVEMVTSKASNLPQGYSLYRGAGISYLEKLTGKNSDDEGFLNSVQALVGKEITHESVTSCAPGLVNYFSHKSVVCNIKTGEKSKGYIMGTNPTEGEIILPPKTKVRIKSISVGAPYYPLWDVDVHEPRTATQGTYWDFYELRERETSKQIYIEMEME